MISICSLIYRSKTYADAVWDSAFRHTPQLNDGTARFFFVANDPTPDLVSHLRAKKYPHVVTRNAHLTNEQVFNRGYAKPEYLHRTYKAWNVAADLSDEITCLVSSDMMFSPGWLSGMMNSLSPETMVAGRLVERRHPKFGVFPGALEGNFGSNPANFQENRFLRFAAENKKPLVTNGGAYGPLLFYKSGLAKVGGFPDGNLHGGDFNTVSEYGDAYLMRVLGEAGIRHITTNDAILYHFKEGESEE